MGFDGSVRLIVPIAERCLGGKDPLCGFFIHPLHDLFPEIVGIVFRGDKFDTVHELGLSPRILRQQRSRLYEVDLKIQTVE